MNVNSEVAGEWFETVKAPEKHLIWFELHKRSQDFEMGIWMVRNVTTLSSRLGIRLAVALLAAIGTISAAAQSRIEIAAVHSPGLEPNLLGDSADQTVAIYLPAAYQTEPQKRFATIYFLHGFADTPAKGVAEIVQEHMDKLLATQTIEPMIVVAPNGLNRLLGSFYVNSQVTGNWEDYVARDVVAYVDSHYRTLPRPESRGISGHSMGGYGALMLGFKHPDVFSFIYAMSPCAPCSKAIWRRLALSGHEGNR
jgi:S-formylglutathione hydrolase